MKSSKSIRKDFIEFFRERNHTFVPSSPVIPQDDPTLYFTNAGMNQFKAIFLGDNKEGLRRAANSQKCMRVSGKHNDLEEVGRDHYHHTFFEMLGNWSFGDYYKKEAIQWAWELLTGTWGLPKAQLYATIFRDDDEAEELWKEVTDIDPTHISRHGEKDNFWEMGETGPCGPCSEVHMDLGEGVCDGKGHTCGVNVDGCARYMELWNLVFMQYNRERDGSLHELPKKHIDTGMGFERIVRVIQGVNSNYDSDLFRPIIAQVEKMSGVAYQTDERGTPFRVIADHIRALTFAITDGAIPSNDGRGYVLRRLLRRAYRFGRELGFGEPFLHTLVPEVIAVIGDAFPEIQERQDYVVDVIRSEEERFGQTLEQGISRFEEIIQQEQVIKSKRLSGSEVFTLYDTFGFPMDLTRLMAEEKGLSIDEAGFQKEMEAQRERARDAAKRADSDGLTADGWTGIQETGGTEYVGYGEEASKGKVYRYKKIDSDTYLLMVDRTPFYAESGGQIGDTGTISTATGKDLEVIDTFKWNESVVHKVRSAQELTEKDFADPSSLLVDGGLRASTRRNHSATHLLQAALRSVLGDHVQQSGSRVGPEGLRFDFTHFKALSADELTRVERIVNEHILQNLPVNTEIQDLNEAKQGGATALFGEKYGDKVRVVAMGPVSKELCGGTHVSATGEIGIFHITAETSISAGVRRIEAVTGLGALDILTKRETTVVSLARMLKVSEDSVEERVGDLLLKVKDLETQIGKLSQEQAGREIASILDEAAQNSGSFPWIVKDLGELDKNSFKDMANAISDLIRDRKLDTTVVVVGANVDGKALFAASAGQDAVGKHKVHCGNLVKMAASTAGGGGGGSPVRAQAGGKDPSKLSEALTVVQGHLRELN